MRRTLRITIEIPDVPAPLHVPTSARYVAADVLAMIAADGNYDDVDTRVVVEYASPTASSSLSGDWFQKSSRLHYEASGERFMEVA